MDALKRKKRSIKGYVTRSKDALESIVHEQSGILSIEKLSELEAAMQVFRRYANQFEEVVDNILIASDDTNATTYSELEKKYLDEVAIVNNTIIEYEGRIKAFHRRLEGANSRDSIASSTNAVCNAGNLVLQPKLQDISIPKFNGNIVDFPNWKALFENLIHNNTAISPIMKLHRLKEALENGEAHKLVRDFPLTEPAYVEAYSALCSRYDNKRTLIRALFRQLHNLEAVSSTNKLRSVLDNVDSIVRGLKAAGEQVDDTFSRYIAFSLSLRLDRKTAEDWENSISSNRTFPLYNELQKFLQNRVFSTEERIEEKPVQSAKSPSKPPSPNKIKPKSSFAVNQKVETCGLCKKEKHSVFHCDGFLSKSPRDRYEQVKKAKLCLICFKDNHATGFCPNTSSHLCHCGKRHNHLLHFGSSPAETKTSHDAKLDERKPNVTVNREQETEPNSNDFKQAFSCSTLAEAKEELVLLPSAIVRFRCGDKTGKARILLDSCSQPTLASDAFVRKNRIPTFKSNSAIKGVATSSIGSSSAIELIIGSRNNKFNISVQASVVPASCLSYSAETSFPLTVIEKLKGLELAEPCLTSSNTRIDSIDLVIGAKYFGDCILDGAAKIDSLNLRRSHFGWIVSGVTPVRKNSVNNYCGLTLDEINENLKKFWEIENVEPSSKFLTLEEERCVKHFEENYAIADDGKFIVKLPLKNDRSKIANTRKRAENALIRVEKKLSPQLKIAYSDFINEYRALGHMSIAKSNDDRARYYIPHREVIRETSSTTPLRVVFNASAKTDGKLSLNDALMIGPVIQRDIFDILISFRLPKFVFVGDVEKMYRMIWIHPSDRDLQRILWRESPGEPFIEFVLNTLTYGTAPASFIAQKCLQTIAESCERQMPDVAKVIKDNVYMDDVNGGAESEEAMIELSEKIRAVLQERGFKLRKFASNSQRFLKTLPSDLRAVKTLENDVIDQGELTVLGVSWVPDKDEIGVQTKIDCRATEQTISRRIALSIISKTFDPLGLLAPALITGKMLLQDFWKEEKEWDALTSDEISEKFRSYIKSVQTLNNIRIPRQIFEHKLDAIFAFGDASEKAYCAAVYARYVNENDERFCRLICSKTRVAPIKAVIIHKLELQAAKLLADLAKRVCHDLNINKERVIAFSDSTAVLCWLSKPANDWKIFVGNRVEKIVEIIPFRNWRFVKTYANPADKATRGLSAEEFNARENYDLWFNGPKFLRRTDADSFFPIPDLSTRECLEKRKEKDETFSGVASSSCSQIIDRFSSYTRLLNSFARLVRIARSWKGKVRIENTAFAYSEINNARNVILRLCQRESYAAEIDRLKVGASIKKKSVLRSLDPFLDENSLLRVGGRIAKSSLPLEKKHPLIISGKSSFIKLYCRYVHEKYYHAGKKFLVAFLTSEFWIHKGRTNMIKGVIRNCVICRRLSGKNAVQIMGQLPLPRIQVARPFTYVGVDYAGYFKCKCTAHRSTKFSLIYAAIFVCLVTRAIHIEVVTDLSTNALIEAVMCLISRRGLPKVIYSDNGSNMTGAANILAIDAEKLLLFSAHERFDWKFIPPNSPNFGGVWEAGVKSTKRHLSAVSGGHALTIVEYGNVFRRIEAILNSRPLCYRNDVEQGSEVITPAHFLIGSSLLALPVLDYSDDVTLSRRLTLLQNQVKGFWSVWSRDYLNQMQQRTRWTSREPNLRVGQVVLVKSENTKPFQWPLGRIEKIFPDNEGIVRVVEVLFRGTVKKRSISTLVPLLTEEEFSANDKK